MKEILKNKAFRNMMLINMFFGATEALFALRTLFLSTAGMDPAQIGVVFSVSNFLGTVAPLIGGALADRFFSRYRVFVVAVFGYGAVVALLPLSADIRIGGTILAMIAMPMLQVFHPVGSNMIATCSINAAYSSNGVDYSMFRIWMSMGYTIANFSFTPLIQAFGIDAPYYLALLFFVGIILLRKSVKKFEVVRVSADGAEDQTVDNVDKKSVDFKAIIKNYYIVIFTVISIIYAAANNCAPYISYVLELNKVDTSQIGVVSAVKVLGEVVIMLIIPKLKKKVSLSGLQLLAGLFLCTELLLMQFAKNLLAISLVEMLGGIGNGIALSTAGLYVRTLAPKGLEATAQSLWSMGTSLGGIILSSVFGVIIKQYGVLFNYSVALIMQLIWVALFLLSFAFGKYVLKKKTIQPVFFLKSDAE